MKVVVVIQVQEKMNEVLSVLRKRSRVFDESSNVGEIIDWAESYLSRVGDIKFIPLEKD